MGQAHCGAVQHRRANNSLYTRIGSEDSEEEIMQDTKKLAEKRQDSKEEERE